MWSAKLKLLNLVMQDLQRGALHYRVWLHLGRVEVKQRYRRSVIGPWWISLSMLIFILMMGVVFSRLFHQSLDEYIPFFTAGFLFWAFFSSSVIEAAEIFKANGGFIKQMNLPFSLYVFTHIVKQIIFLLHNAVVYLLVCCFFGFNPGFSVLLVLPGLLLFVINVYWLSFLIAVICARFRDVVPIISSCTQIAFFVTPISWMPRLLDGHSGILKYNPLVYLIDVVRSPLLGKIPPMMSWSVSAGLAISGCAIGLLLFAFARPRIAFWVD